MNQILLHKQRHLKLQKNLLVFGLIICNVYPSSEIAVSKKVFKLMKQVKDVVGSDKSRTKTAAFFL